jgi:ATP-dependent RNA circularization protein (DNA/RNA ligase family)
MIRNGTSMAASQVAGAVATFLGFKEKDLYDHHKVELIYKRLDQNHQEGIPENAPQNPSDVRMKKWFLHTEIVNLKRGGFRTTGRNGMSFWTRRVWRT